MTSVENEIIKKRISMKKLQRLADALHELNKDKEAMDKLKETDSAVYDFIMQVKSQRGAAEDSELGGSNNAIECFSNGGTSE